MRRHTTMHSSWFSKPSQNTSRLVLGGNWRRTFASAADLPQMQRHLKRVQQLEETADAAQSELRHLRTVLDNIDLSRDLAFFGSMRLTHPSFAHALSPPRHHRSAAGVASEGHAAAQSKDQALRITAAFLRRELPIRVAHCLNRLDRFPHGLGGVPSVANVRNLYFQSFKDLRDFAERTAVQPANVPLQTDDVEPTGVDWSSVPFDEARLADFENVLLGISSRHGPLTLTSQGTREMRKRLERRYGKDDFWENPTTKEVQHHLDAFLLQRQGMRLLIAHALTLFEQVRAEKSGAGDPDVFGIVHRRTRPYDEIARAAEDARVACIRRFGAAPRVEIKGTFPESTVAHIPTIIHRVALQVVADRLYAATQPAWKEFGGNREELVRRLATGPPVRITVADSPQSRDFAFKVSDEAGGMSREEVPHVWSYFRNRYAAHDGNGNSEDEEHPDEYGLLLARHIARFFGGDILVTSVEHWGTDVVVQMLKQPKESANGGKSKGTGGPNGKPQ
eukprot:TRINITY_DN2042_c1_g1_i1.p1 TRINITY_DN2042_c1_g1~~TRINITY_DN2042_c1_g1_i1.p1  ORF type:complete len:506 (-),score=86.48 TRINITY_DN2042_c1_g1_i1:147-1664(-)